MKKIIILACAIIIGVILYSCSVGITSASSSSAPASSSSSFGFNTTPPNITLTEPTGSAVYYGTVTFRGTASDDNGLSKDHFQIRERPEGAD